MSFRDWRKWFRQLPWSCRWFVIFVLIRPITDNFYNLKEISPLYSPLYIMGILTPVFILFSFLGRRFPKRQPNPVDWPAGILMILILLNGVVLLAVDHSLFVVGEVLKSVTPFLLYFYLRHFVRSERDLTGILQAFLYSCIFPCIILLYENIFNPIAIEYVTEGRGGGSRIRGGYADVMSYAIFITGFFLIVAYYFVGRLHAGRHRSLNMKKMLVVIGLVLLGLISIKQVSTWAVVSVLFFMLLLRSVRNSRSVILSLLVVLLVLPFFVQTVFDKEINPLVQKEIAVANGETDIEYAFNGRVGRWERYLGIWSDMPVQARLFGVAFSGADEAPVMISGGIHNDFIRMMFLTGIAGLLLYFIFLYMIFRSRLLARLPERFLISGAVACIVLHSISALPLLYASYVYLLMAVFAFAALPYAAKYGLAATPGGRSPVSGNLVAAGTRS